MPTVGYRLLMRWMVGPLAHYVEGYLEKRLFGRRVASKAMSRM